MNKTQKNVMWTIVVVSLVGLGWWMLSQRAQDKQMVQQATPVTLADVKTMDIARSKTYSGTLQATNKVTLVAENHGRISQIHCHAGSEVKRGDVLFELDPSLTDAQVAKAKAMDFAARTEWNRHKNLWKEKATSQSKMEQVFSQWRQAKAELAVALANQKAMKVVAPFDGTVGIFSVTLGTHVSPQQELARLVSSKDLCLIFNVPESDAKYILPDNELSILAESHDPLPVKGRVAVIDPFSDPHTHTVRVKATVGAEKSALQDGAFAQVSVELESAKNALVVPREAVLTEPEGTFVFVAVNHENALYALKRPVILGVQSQSYSQVLSGVTTKDKIVVDPVGSLHHTEQIMENNLVDDDDQADNSKTTTENAS